MVITGVELRDACCTFAGERYDQGPGRTSTVSGYKDCSGLPVAGFAKLGRLGIPTVSSTQARYCHDNGGLISIDQALRTPGALLSRGANLGMEGYGNDGHSAESMGDGVNVIEARGHAYGVLIDSALGRHWDAGYLWPDVDYGTHPTPHPHPIPHQARRLYYVPKNPMRGDDVLEVETKLAQWAFLIASAGNLPASRAINPGVIGNAYGRKAVAKVAAFQRLAGIKPDGIVGAVTWRTLFAL